MSHLFSTVITAFVLFIGMLLCLELGRRICLSSLKNTHVAEPKGLGAMEGAVFALLGLLIAFTFSGAASRFENRRLLIGNETNTISTAYLRLDLLPESARMELQILFRRYLETRLALYSSMEDPAITKKLLDQQAQFQGEIWRKAVAVSSRPRVPSSVAMLVLPALNEMIDITNTRSVATQNHPPKIIFFLFGVISLLSSLLAGYSMAFGMRSWLHTIIYSAVISITIFVILDLEYPRKGIIRIDSADKVLVELLRSMK
jgi:hypothetical protein